MAARVPRPAPAGKVGAWPSSLLMGALLSVFAGLLLLPYFRGHWRLADDAYYFTVPAALLQARTMLEGMWPFWNPNVGLGQPWGLAVGGGVFYPVQIFWGLLIGWSEVKYLLFVWLHLATGGWFAASFGRRAGLDTRASLFFAMAAVGSGLNIGFFSNPLLFVPYLAWPLLGEGLLRLHQEAGRPAAAIRRIVAGLVLIELGGYPLSKLVIYGSTALCYLAMAWRPGQRLGGIPWKRLAAASALAVAITLPQQLVFFGAMGWSERAETSSVYDDSQFHNVANFLLPGSMLLPHPFMVRNQPQLGSMHLERSWWVGILTVGLLLAGLASGALELRRYRAAMLTALAGLFFALGGHSFVRELAAGALPLLDNLRHSHLGRMPLNFLVCFLGAAALQALAGARAASPAGGGVRGGGPGRKLAWAWGGFLAACAVAALSEAEHPQLARQLYFDEASGWKLSALHMGFYLLLAYTARLHAAALPKALGWAGAMVALQLLSLADVGHAFRNLIAERRERPFKTVEPGFAVASPQPNERSLKGWFDGDDWYSPEGNRKILNAYFPPMHKWFARAKQDPRIAPLLGSLASCQSVGSQAPAPNACPGTAFQIDYHFGNRIVISGRGPAPAWIVAHDFHHPHWVATVNGQAAPVLLAYDYLKAVEVPAGDWRIELEYRHPGFPLAWWFPALALGLLAAPARRWPKLA